MKKKSLNEESLKGNSRKIPFKKLVKGATLVNSAPALIIVTFIMNGFINPVHAIILLSFIFLLSLLFIYPYLADLQQLTHYVSNLSASNEVKPPELSFLNNVEVLSQSITELHENWLLKNKYLQDLLEEDKYLINTLPDIVILLDKQFNIIGYNNAVKLIIGDNYKFFLGEIITNKVIKEKLIATAKEEKQKEKIEKFIYSISEPKEIYFMVNIEKFPVVSPSKISYIIVMQDITIERKTQNMLKDFIANASHEMKTPLAGIRGFLETILDSQPDKATRDKFLQIMKEQSARLENLVEDLLLLSLVEAGLDYNNIKSLDANILIKHDIKILQNLAEEKNITINFMPDNIKQNINIDENDFNKLFSNILSNAIKYSYNDSKIDIKTYISYNRDKNFLEYAAEQKFYTILVSDYGEGIAQEDIGRITERFYRVDKARSRKVGGSGLGLSIVKTILQNYNAKLEIISEKSVGSNFVVYFPI